MATQKTGPKTNKGSNKSSNNTKKNTNKSTGRKKPTKKQAEASRVAQLRLLGVCMMLLGLMLGLWFLVLMVGVFMSAPTPGQVAANLAAGLANITLAMSMVYFGYGFYSGRQGRFDGWQVAGCCFFLLAMTGLLHLPQLAEGLLPAWRLAMGGFGGGVCGFLTALAVGWLPSQTARYIVLLAFLLLGLILATDLKLFAGVIGALRQLAAKAAARAEEEEEPEEAAPPIKRPKTGEKPEGWQTEKMEISLPPVITEYSGRRFEETDRADYERVSVNQMLGNDGPEVMGAEREFTPRVIGITSDLRTHRPAETINMPSKSPEAQAKGVVYEKLAELAEEEFNPEEYTPEHQGIVISIFEGGQGQEQDESNQHDNHANDEDKADISEYPEYNEEQYNEEKHNKEKHDEAELNKKLNNEEKISEENINKEKLSNESPKHEIKHEGASAASADEPQGGTLRRVVNYQLPPISLMKGGITIRNSRINQRIMDDSQVLTNVLASFGVKTQVVEVVCGPSIIRYELQPAPGVKISRIVSLADDIALALAARGLRIEAPVPGKSVVGIEVAREETSPVYFKDVLGSENFQKSKSKISMALGVDINGNAIVGDLAEMPHLLIAGATGSGKSVCMNTLICSIIYKARPEEVKFIMVDPKKVELTGYSGLPHLGRPVVTDPKKAAQVLKEVVNEMERRYLVFVNSGVKNFATYNALPDVVKLPQIVVLIDELADLMMVASREVEDAICRLAQMARAAGIHLVIATQRPSVDVITGLIKANIPSRIAFAVSSQIDSRTILDMGGAEKLLGKGDMLYYPIGRQKPLRVQGAFLTEEEIHDLVEYCKRQAEPEYLELPEANPNDGDEEAAPEEEKSLADELYLDACQQVISSGQASASSLQRRFRIGYNRAARLIEDMEADGIVSAPEGNRRTVLMSMGEFADKFLDIKAVPEEDPEQ